MKRLEELADLVPGARIAGDKCTEITSIERDSRRASEGALFVCINGVHVDAHSFIPNAARAGARAVLTERDKVAVPPGTCRIFKRRWISSCRIFTIIPRVRCV